MLKIVQDDSRSNSTPSFSSSFCPVFKDDQAWSLLAAVKASLSDNVVQQALASSEWILDNGKLPEQSSSRSDDDTNRAWVGNNNSTTNTNGASKMKVIPIKTAHTKYFTFEAFTVKA